MGYSSLAEKLAERFHTTEAVLAELTRNWPTRAVADRQPTAADRTGRRQTPRPIAYRAGMQLRVPNIGADRFDPPRSRIAKWADDPAHARGRHRATQGRQIEVDKSDQVLRVLDGEGKLIAQFTATMGSSHVPLPIGTWKIQGTGFNPAVGL